MKVLRDGGTAVDAAVATTLCQGVMNPMASGIGGALADVDHVLSVQADQAWFCPTQWCSCTLIAAAWASSALSCIL